MRNLIRPLLIVVVVLFGIAFIVRSDNRAQATRRVTTSNCELRNCTPTPFSWREFDADDVPLVMPHPRMAPLFIVVHETGHEWGGTPTSSDAVFNIVISPGGECWLARDAGKMSVEDPRGGRMISGLPVALAYDGGKEEPTKAQVESLGVVASRFVSVRRQKAGGDTVVTCRYTMDDPATWGWLDAPVGQQVDIEQDDPMIVCQHCPRGITVDELGGPRYIVPKHDPRWDAFEPNPYAWAINHGMTPWDHPKNGGR